MNASRLIHQYPAFFLPCIILMCAPEALGRDIRVNSIPELRDALSEASPGDKIIVADGTYHNTRQLDISAAGTKLQPIEISAETVGGVEIDGAAGFAFRPTVAFVTLRG